MVSLSLAVVAWREFMSPKVLGEGKGFQDEPDEEKVLPPNGWTSCLS